MPHLRMVKLPTSTDDRAYEERWIYVMYLCVNLDRGVKKVIRFIDLLRNVTTDLSQTAKWLIISMKSEMIIFCIISNWWLSNKIARKQTKNVIILLSNSVTRTRSAWKLWNCDAKEVMYYNSNVISFSIAAGVAKNVSEKCMDTKQVNQKVR